MKGDERVRMCAACHCKVFNFAKISSEEARQLIRRNSEGERICARIFVRFDGTVLTKDCPRGYSYGWQVAKKLLPGRGVLVVLTALLAVFIGTATLFVGNIRMLRSTIGTLGGTGPGPEKAPAPPNKKRINFDQNNAY